jgi:hypothetical protein|tara:strand:+ start:559 stop:759 length:201 start_codon:yes stop_codon:yes gene_type:complete
MTEESKPNIDLSKIKVPKSPMDGLTKEQELQQMIRMYDSAPDGMMKQELGFRITFLELEIKNKQNK